MKSAIIVVVCLLISLPCFGQEMVHTEVPPSALQAKTPEELRAEILNLWTVIQRLETRISELEKAKTPPPPVDPVPVPPPTVTPPSPVSVTITVDEMRNEKRLDLSTHTDYQSLLLRRQPQEDAFEAAQKEVDRMKAANKTAQSNAAILKSPYVAVFSDTEVSRAIRRANNAKDDLQATNGRIRQFEEEAAQLVAILKGHAETRVYEVECKSPSAAQRSKRIKLGDQITVGGVVREIRDGVTVVVADKIDIAN